MKRLVVLLPLVALCGCSAAQQQSELQAAATYAPLVEGAVCTLAASQGAAEPGWEVYVCRVLDAAGRATSVAFALHTRKGAPPVTSNVLAPVVLDAGPG